MKRGALIIAVADDNQERQRRQQRLHLLQQIQRLAGGPLRIFQQHQSRAFDLTEHARNR